MQRMPLPLCLARRLGSEKGMGRLCCLPNRLTSCLRSSCRRLHCCSAGLSCYYGVPLFRRALLAGQQVMCSVLP